MYHCSVHNIDHPSWDCPRCEAERRHEELVGLARESRDDELQRHAATIEALEESDYRRANPGDYECPYCLYITLKRGASRCPICHASITPEYWDQVREREKAEAETRARLQREAAEKQARLERERASQEQQARERGAARQASEFGSLLLMLVLCGLIGLAVYLSTNGKIATSETAARPPSQPATPSYIPPAPAVVPRLPGARLLKGDWIDQSSITNWNRPGMEIPRADGTVEDRCKYLLREPAGPEEKMVVAAGWGIIAEAWQRGATVVAKATSRSGGMCLAQGTQVFVFADGRFAGTLSPEPTDSFDDGFCCGLITGTSTGNEIAAAFYRFEENDGHCCPSRVSYVRYRITSGEGRPIVVPVGTQTIDTSDGLPPYDAHPLPGASLRVEYETQENVVRPVLREVVEPEYGLARDAGIAGTVVTKFLVDEAGIPRDIRILQSLEPEFDDAVRRALSDWRFRPGSKNSTTVAVLATAKITLQ